MSSPRTPLPHQQDAVTVITRAFDSGADKGQMIHACGSGKTLTCQFLSTAIASQLTLVTVPSIALVRQTMLEWASQAGNRLQMRAVCSDPNAGLQGAEYGLGNGTVLTAVEDIAEFLSSQESNLPKVIFSTYQSSPKIAAAVSQASADLRRAVSFDLVICDEAHRLTGETDREYSTVLNRNLIPAKRTIFTTATPKITDAGNTRERFTAMDDEGTFGTVLHRYTFRQAIQDGRLTDYRLVILSIDPDGYRQLPAFDDENHKRAVAAQIATLQAMRTYDLRRLVTFHSTIDRAKHFSTNLKSLNRSLPTDQRLTDPFRASYINGSMPHWERAAAMELLGSDVDGHRIVMSNPRCLTEGVDVPSLDGIVMVDPRKSTVDTVQMIGRVLRTAPGKTFGTIVIPVILPQGANLTSEMNGAGFAQAWRIIAALRDHDEDMAAYIDAAAAVLPSGQVPGPAPQIVVEGNPANTVALSALVRVKMVEQTASTPVRLPQRFYCACGCGQIYSPFDETKPFSSTEFVGAAS